MISNNDGNIGIGFAITAETVRKFMANQLQNGNLLPPPPPAAPSGEGYGGGGYGHAGTKTAAADSTATVRSPDNLQPQTTGTALTPLGGIIVAPAPRKEAGVLQPTATFRRFVPRSGLLAKGDGF